MLVSIIIPIYNVAPYVEKCLRSVIAQTYRKLEVIIVDDCGTDNSMEIVERVIAENKTSEIGFKILHHEKNRGLSAARNTGIRTATGDYLFFLDSDDLIAPICIDFLVKFTVKYPGVDIVQGGYYSNPPEVVKWTHSQKLFPKDVEYIQNPTECRKLLQQKGHLGFMHNKLTKRSFIIENNLYNDERMKMMWEDSLWTFLAGRYIKDIAFCNIPLYGYRYRPGSIMRSCNLNASAHSTAIICDKILRSLSLDKWIFKELRFVLWRIEEARNMGISIKQLIHEYRLCNSMGERQ